MTHRIKSGKPPPLGNTPLEVFVQLLKSITLSVSLTFFALTALATVPAHAHWVVSDIDDTIKLSAVGHPIDMIDYAFFDAQFFAGMIPLYSALAADNTVDFISGSPGFLGPHLRSIFEDAHMPAYNLRTKSTFSDPSDIMAYKLKALEALQEQSSEPKILLGDDTQKDPETYLEFQRRHPESVTAIYIHEITRRALPDGVQSFRISYEVAFSEFRAGRITEEQLLDIGRKMLADPKSKRWMPSYAGCSLIFEQDLPSAPSQTLREGELTDSVLEMNRAIRARFNKTCAKKMANK